MKKAVFLATLFLSCHAQIIPAPFYQNPYGGFQLLGRYYVGAPLAPPPLPPQFAFGPPIPGPIPGPAPLPAFAPPAPFAFAPPLLPPPAPFAFAPPAPLPAFAPPVPFAFGPPLLPPPALPPMPVFRTVFAPALPPPIPAPVPFAFGPPALPPPPFPLFAPAPSPFARLAVLFGRAKSKRDLTAKAEQADSSSTTANPTTKSS